MRQVVTKEVSIQDLGSLRAHGNSSRAGSRNNNSKNFDDTLKTSSTMESSLSNSQNFFEPQNSKNNGNFNGNNSTGKSASSFHWSGKSLNMMDSCSTSFSDLAAERSLDFSRDSFESSTSYDPDFGASASSLDWDIGEAFPKSKRSSETASTTSSTVDMSEFMVLSAFQVDGNEKGTNNADFDSKEDKFPDQDSCDGEESAEEEQDSSDGDEGQGLQSQQVAVPPPRVDSVRRGDRRATLQREAEERERQDHAEKAALCQHLARNGIDNSTRGRGRQRMGRHTSIGRSESACSERQRSISRHRSLSRQRARGRSVSRDRSTATAPAGTLEVTVDKPLLGKSHAEESDEEEDPWACPWFDRSISTQNAIVDTPVKERTMKCKPTVRVKDSDAIPTSMLDMDSSCKSNGSRMSSKSGKELRNIQRAHSSDDPSIARDRRESKRRSFRETKSAREGRSGMRRPVTNGSSTDSNSSKRTSGTRRSSMKDVSLQSNPERRRRVSLEERLEHMKDISSRSTPVERTVDMEERSRGSAKSHERRRRFPADVMPSRPRRTRSNKTPFEAD